MCGTWRKARTAHPLVSPQLERIAGLRGRPIRVSRNLAIESQGISNGGNGRRTVVDPEHVLPLVLLAPQDRHDGVVLKIIVEHDGLRDLWFLTGLREGGRGLRRHG